MQINIVKIGGNVIDNPETLKKFIEEFSRIEGPKILVHGGGVLASRLSEKLNIEPKMVNGRRITDENSLDVVTMVYAGLVNKKIVALLQAQDENAIGLTGADGNLITSVKRPVKDIDYGYVGDIIEVNVPLLETILSHNYVPIVAAITHDKNGQLLNTNADTITAELGLGLAKHHEVSLFYGFDKNGVLKDINDDDSNIPEINFEEYQHLQTDKTIHSGMIPKLDNAFKAISKGINQVWLGKAEDVRQAINSKSKGTFLKTQTN
ncbi:acetylglutamate kinase [Litoribacter populi]|uniref:acetylglutamate kinase n=1 Tax=Litoribacter populi TaxID=2598460 RepID=UPI00117D3509|nr:acetylglutamate kinase [Litoribacter populi]